MVIIDYSKKHHKKIIHACVLALKQGRVVAYPTDTSYGLAVDTTNISAIKKLYKIKGRNFNKPSSVVVPSESYAKKLVKWNSVSSTLVKRFWPLLRLPLRQGFGGQEGFGGQAGAITIALPIRNKNLGLNQLCSKDGYLSLRMPKNNIALNLVKYLGRPITATSANVSGMPDCYSASDIIKQFTKQKLKPDIIINAGKLPKRKPSTVVKIINNEFIEIIRQGPVSEKQILKILKLK